MSNENTEVNLIWGDSAMAQQMRNFNWSVTALGAITTWPSRLISYVNLVVNSPTPMLLLWGPAAYCISNDAFLKISPDPTRFEPGIKFDELWPGSAQLTQNVLSKCLSGQALSFKNYTFKISKEQKNKEVILDLDFSPIPGVNGKPDGIMCIARDATQQVLTETNLRNKEERLRFALQASQDGIWDWDFKNDKAWWNDRYSEILGLDIPYEKRGLNSVTEFIHPDDRNKIPDALKAHLETGKIFEVEFRNLRPSGEIRYIEGKGNAIKDEDGNISRLTGIICDVTEHKLAQEALIESEFRFRQLANSLPIVVWTASPDGNLTYISNQWEEFYGNPVSESLGLGWTNFVHKDDIAVAGKLWETSLKTGVTYETEFRVNYKKKGYHWILVRALPVKDESGKILSWYGSNTDIQEKKVSEQTVKESEQRFRTMAENISQLAWMTDDTGWIFWYNKRWFDYTGTTMDDMEGWGWEKVHHPDYLQLVKNKFVLAIQTTEPWEDTFPLLGKDGVFRWFLSRAVPIKNEEGKVLRWFGTNTDITELMHTELALKESEERFRTMAESTDIFIAVGDEASKAEYFNTAWTRLTGRPMDDILKFGWADLIHDEDRADYINIYQTAFEIKGPFTCEFRILSKDGEYHWLLAKGVPRFRPDNSFAGYISSYVDITDRKKSEEALKESSDKFKKLLEAVPQMTWTNLPSGEVNFYNEQWYKYTGLTFSQTKDWGWQNVVHPEDLGSTIKNYTHALHNGSVFVTENRYKNAEGQYRWHLNRALPIKNEKGEISLWIGTATDIHEQKAIEEKLEKLVSERTVQLQESNQDLQQFAHVASHDLKEPLRKIKIYTGRVSDEFSDLLPPAAKEFIGKIQTASNRMQAMIDGVLTYSSVNSIQQGITLLDLNGIIKHIETDLELLISQKRTSIEIENLPKIEGAAVLIYQLFYNLINNALKFSRTDIKPVIFITGEHDERYAKIYVSDNGIGFEPEYTDKIFETFVRLNSKDTYDGTGLGLALCKKITLRHGGNIKAEGQLNKGARFTITLPLTQNKQNKEML